MNKLKLSIEIDPLPQPRPRFSKGRCYEPARISAYKEAIGYQARVAMKGNAPPIDAVKVCLKFWRKYKATSRRFADADNLAKAVMDACNGILWQDDSQIVSLTAEKYQGTPRLEIEVLPFEENKN